MPDWIYIPLSSQTFRGQVRSFIRLLVSFFVFVSACVPQTPNSNPEDFQSVLKIKTDPRFQLETYAGEGDETKLDFVAFRVSNYTDKTIFFQNQSLGVRAYKHEVVEKTWKPVPVDFAYASLEPISLPSGDPTKFLLDAFQKSWFKEKGKLRLVIVGWTDPQNPKDSQIAAYADIEIK